MITKTAEPKTNPNWFSLVFSPFPIGAFIIHICVAVGFANLTNGFSYNWYVLASGCLLFGLMGSFLVAMGVLAKRNFNKLRDRIACGNLPSDFRITPNTHRSLITIGILCTTPMLWLIPLIMAAFGG